MPFQPVCRHQPGPAANAPVTPMDSSSAAANIPVRTFFIRVASFYSIAVFSAFIYNTTGGRQSIQNSCIFNDKSIKRPVGGSCQQYRGLVRGLSTASNRTCSLVCWKRAPGRNQMFRGFLPDGCCLFSFIHVQCGESFPCTGEPAHGGCAALDCCRFRTDRLYRSRQRAMRRVQCRCIFCAHIMEKESCF